MLDESTQHKQAQKEQDVSSSTKVTCFVCKREVEREQAQQIFHSKQKQVWVCAAHIKK